MLNEYKIIRLPKQNIFLAFARLVLIAIVLQLCVLYIPSLVGLAKESSDDVQEKIFVYVLLQTVILHRIS